MSGTKVTEMIKRVAKGDDAAVVVRESVEAMNTGKDDDTTLEERTRRLLASRRRKSYR